MEGFYKLVFFIFNNFLIFNIIGSLSRKGFLKKILIKVFSYSEVLVLVSRKEYLLPK